MSEQLDRIQDSSVQTRDAHTGVSQFRAYLLHGLFSTGALAPRWYSAARDEYLRRTVYESDHLSSATNSMASRIAAIPSRVEPRDPTIKAHRDLADKYNIIWNELSNFGTGKYGLVFNSYQDYSIQDNGFFLEFIGDGSPDGPIEGPVLSIANLDASRCQRTGNYEFPVIYTANSGKQHKMHRTRVGFASSMTSTLEEMHGVGFCAVSRALNNAQHLIDIGIYEQEKLGSRPKRQFLITNGGLDPEDVAHAIQMVDSNMSNQGLSRYAKAVLLGDATLPDANLLSVDLASIPDGFDKQTSTTLGMFAIALAFGVPVRWLWPATSAGATKADAMFQHIAGQGPGVGHFLSVFTNILAGPPEGKTHIIGKFLPPSLRLIFDFVDDEQDRTRAENKKVRIEGWEKHLQNATMDVRTVREQMLRNTDLTEAQFERLELEDGRLPDGNDVLTLFSSTDPLFLTLLDLGVSNPLAIAANEPVDMVVEIDAAAMAAQDLLVSAPNQSMKSKASMALSALGKLKEIYTGLISQEIQAEMTAEQEQEETEEEKPTQEETPQEEKQFNFSAGAGEVIAGSLARGAGGRFVNVANLQASLRSAILAKIRGRQGETGLSKAELKRQENREKVADELGITGLDAMAAMRDGEQPDPEQAADLESRGLVERQEDGTFVMSPAGRGLMRAANSGDIDAAKSAVERAKKPKRGKKAPGRAGLTPEQREADRQLRIRETRDQTFDTISSQDISRNSLTNLQNFREGGDLGDSGIELANNGLVEFDADGVPRLTSAGRTLLSASDKGDSRRALDALSVSRERVEKTEERANAALERLNEIEGQIESLQERIDANDPTSDTFDIELANDLQERIAGLQERAREQRDRADELLTKIGMKEGQETKSVPFDVRKDGESDYRRAIRAAVRGLWTGNLDIFQFEDSMSRAFRRGLRRAWNEGAAKAGIKPGELEIQETVARDQQIARQIEFLPPFTMAISENSKANGGKLTPLLVRAEMWANRYNEVKEQAFGMAAGNKKLKWKYSPIIIDHCKDCERYDDRVYRAKTWLKYGIRPKSYHLDCRGIYCGCTWFETDEDVTPGRPPSPSN